jgi:hypothetical protein
LPTNDAPKYAAVIQWIAANLVAAPPITLAITTANNTFLVAYGPVMAGNTYILLSSTDLTTGAWLPLTSLTGWQTNGTQISVTDCDPNRPRKFYRVQISSP